MDTSKMFISKIVFVVQGFGFCGLCSLVLERAIFDVSHTYIPSILSHITPVNPGPHSQVVSKQMPLMHSGSQLSTKSSSSATSE